MRGQTKPSSACRSPKPRENALKLDFARAAPRPTFLGTKVFEAYDLADLCPS